MIIDVKPEHIVGKTIVEALITGNSIELKFTDGTEAVFNLTQFGYDGARIDSSFWPVQPEGGQ